MLLLWQGASWILGVEVLPGPWRTLLQLQREIADPDFGKHLAETSKAFFTALLIAVVAGPSLGLMLGARRLAEIGRASCRERVCQYVSISVVAVSLKKKNNANKSHRMT